MENIVLFLLRQGEDGLEVDAFVELNSERWRELNTRVRLLIESSLVLERGVCEVGRSGRRHDGGNTRYEDGVWEC